MMQHLNMSIEQSLQDPELNEPTHKMYFSISKVSQYSCHYLESLQIT